MYVCMYVCTLYVCVCMYVHYMYVCVCESQLIIKNSHSSGFDNYCLACDIIDYSKTDVLVAAHGAGMYCMYVCTVCIYVCMYVCLRIRNDERDVPSSRRPCD
jgi:hypothetical protein